MTPANEIRAQLAGQDRRSNRQVVLVLERLHQAPEETLKLLLPCLWDTDPCIRMRAADALEKFSRDSSQPIQPLRRLLIGLAAETTQKELRWHLAVILPRLRLTMRECRQVEEILETYLTDRSSIVKTFAMQGLFDLARQHTQLQSRLAERIQQLTKTGTPAMQARGRILLKTFATCRKNPPPKPRQSVL